MGAIAVFDITRARTFQNIVNWLDELRRKGPQDMTILLIGNKQDLKKRREVGENQAQELADQNNITYMETSALTNENVSETFY